MSNEEIATRILSKIELTLLSYLPEPDCPRKKDINNWNKEQVKKKVAEKLYPQGLGITIDIS